MTEEYWYLKAECRSHPYEWWDSVESVGGKQFYPHLTQAREVCNVCPVFNQCRIDGKDELTGIWASEPKGV